jgi:MORC family CW-type zinc finger protein
MKHNDSNDFFPANFFSLKDNAVDPDVRAARVDIDVINENGTLPTMLTITDNGSGLDEERLHKMLSFGFCEKVSVDNHHPIGHYGNGFKSGSMRLGRDALVFTRDKVSRRVGVGFLSQTFNDEEDIKGLKVPIVFWNADGTLRTPEDEAGQALSIIIRHSPFKTPSELFAQLKLLKNQAGTRIIIYNLKKHGDQFELDFETDPADIRINSYEEDLKEANQSDRGSHRPPRRDVRPYQQYRPGQAEPVPLDYSLREYCEWLYFNPTHTTIFIRGRKVWPHRQDLELAHAMADTYRPNRYDDQTMSNVRKFEILIGLSKDARQTGFMLYHRGRLIIPYLRVGIQQRARAEAIGVVGIIQADFLQPTHNKQGFIDSPAYRACIQSLSGRLSDYWDEISEKMTSGEIRPRSLLSGGAPSQSSAAPTQDSSDIDILTWVKCDKCEKWRALPPGTDPNALPEFWECTMNPNAARSALGCTAPSDDSRPEYKTHKDLAAVRSRKNSQKKRAKQQQQQQEQQQQGTQQEQDQTLGGSDADVSTDGVFVKTEPLGSSVASEEQTPQVPNLHQQLVAPAPQQDAAEVDQNIPVDEIDIFAEETRHAQDVVVADDDMQQDDDAQMELQDDHVDHVEQGDEEMQLDVPHEDRAKRSTRKAQKISKKRKSRSSDDEEPTPQRRAPTGGGGIIRGGLPSRAVKRRKVHVEEHQEDTQLDYQEAKSEYPVAEILASKLVKLAGAVSRMIGREDVDLPEEPEDIAEMDIDGLVSSFHHYMARNKLGSK